RASSSPISMKPSDATGTTTRLPFTSVMANTPRSAARAFLISSSTWSADRSVSTTSSRCTERTPILISIVLPFNGAEPPHRRRSGRKKRRRSRPANGLSRTRKTADAAPGEPRHQLLGRVLGDGAVLGDPVAGAHLRHADQPDPEQVGLVAGAAGVFLDHRADHLGALVERALHSLPHRRHVAQVGLEDQPERLTLGGDEVVERAEGRLHPQLVLGRGR